MANIKIADKPTLDQVKTNTETTNTKIGNTADSGATENTGSVNGKLNKIIGNQNLNMGYEWAGVCQEVTPSTSSFTPSANTTTVKKIASFSISNSAATDVIIPYSFSTQDNNGRTTFFVTTLSAATPTKAQLEAAAKGAPFYDSRAQPVSGFAQIHTTTLTAGTTYYIHAVYETTSASNMPVLAIEDVLVSYSYQTSTPCHDGLKSIQHGYNYYYEGGGSEREVFLQNTVAPDRCLIFVQGIQTETACIYGILLADRIIFPQNLNYTHWQVIEFY